MLTMSSQDKIKEAQRKSAFVVILWWRDSHYICKMAPLLLRCWMKTVPLQSSFIFIYFFFLSTGMKIYNNLH